MPTESVTSMFRWERPEYANATPPKGNGLKLLQYNVRLSYDVMVALFNDDAILDYHVICIQEPWINKHITGNYVSYGGGNASNFHQVTTLDSTGLAATYVRRDIPSDC
jgi:hypothetical protein